MGYPRGPPIVTSKNASSPCLLRQDKAAKVAKLKPHLKCSPISPAEG